ncbi:MAG TPA: hypothetical protein VHH73_13540, partial [Verrucomicrobiae bacterium]|nr:hypothetical protein [Verrucomicrobiae bacterium]
LDPVDLYWGGGSGPGWELWHEQGNTGGFNSEPNRGTSAYWTPDDPTAPYSGNDGQWHYADLGMNSQNLKDGSWLGWTISSGGLDFPNPDAPGSIAWGLHKHAPANSLPAPALASPFASSVVTAQGNFGAAPYDDPASLLGMPSTDFYDPFGNFSGNTKTRRVKLVEPAYNLDATQSGKLITTMSDKSQIIVEFDQPVHDDPANPYGIDFLVFGNTFYSSNDAVNDEANMNSVTLGSGVFSEPTKVSVSPGFTGKPGEDAGNPQTWPWYRYDNGPYGDAGFPTQGYVWDRANTNWTAQPMDFTKPVNPAMTDIIGKGGISAADAIDLYTGAGGGAGFDLATSGFSSVRYLKVEGVSPDYVDGEIDAISAVRPAVLGESLSISPGNLTNGIVSLTFQQPGNPVENLLTLKFASLNQPTWIATGPLADEIQIPTAGAAILSAVHLDASPILGTSVSTLKADLALAVGSSYSGTGGDLDVLQQTGAGWSHPAFTFDATRKAVVVQGLTNLTGFVVTQMKGPQLTVRPSGNGFDFVFTPLPGWTHVLERTTDFTTWTTVDSVTQQSTLAVTLHDAAAPGSRAFYRLKLSHP